MNSDTTSILVTLYNKVSGVPIFDLKAYIEPTASLNISSVWKILTEIFVNVPFMILDAVVGFISLILRFFDNFDLYDTYKTVVYDTSKSLWNGLIGSGDYNHSLMYLLVAITAFTIFVGYIFSKGDVGRRLLHLFAVILLGLGYFGTMQNTSGGLYVLDTIHELAESASKTVSNITIINPENDKDSLGTKASVTDNYIARTAYATYVYVNTGRLDGKYFNNQTGETEDFDDAKIIGSVVDGQFQKADIVERDKEGGVLDELGHDGDKGKEKNRWVSAVNDYIFIKLLYVFFKTVEAIILGLPLVLIQLMSFSAQLLVIFLMIAFPLALLASLAPRLQDVIFNTLKLMLGSSFFPVLTGFLTLMVFYVESAITVFVSNGFNRLSEEELVGFSDFQPVFELMISTVIQIFVFVAMWKNKEKLLTYILGHNQAKSVTRLADGVVNAPDQLHQLDKDTHQLGKNTYELASNVVAAGSFIAGTGTGLALTTKDGLGKTLSSFQGDNYDETIPDLGDSADDDKPVSHLENSTDYDDKPPDLATTINDDDFDSEPDQIDASLYDEIEPIDENGGFDYDQVHQENVPDEVALESVATKEMSLNDFEQELSSEELTDYHKQADSYQEGDSDKDISMESSIEEGEIPQTESSLRTSDSLPTDYRTYRKQAKVDKLKKELSQYYSSEDLGRLETGQSAFKRGLAKTTTKNRQYRMNTKRMSAIEKRLAELRGEQDV